jgi:Acetoacetate decarboxylase (ADC)
MKMEKSIPAPWELTGNGYIMLFKFPKSFILEQGFLDERFQAGFYGNVGTIIFADYRTSNAGPYQELLFMPGKVRYQRHKLHTISKVFVSSQESAENGLSNWGIPKELAAFRLSNEENGLETIKVSQNGVPVFDITIKTSQSDLAFPLRTLFRPFPLVQFHEGKTFWFNIWGKGKGKLAQILKVEVNPELFPNFAFFKHVAIIRVSKFRLKLPLAKVKEEH